MSDRELYEEGLLMDLEKANARIEQLAATNEGLEKLLKDLFVILDKTEESEEGRVFHPNTIRSCRVSDTQKLENILQKLRRMAGESNE